jgi:hypothetical protein
MARGVTVTAEAAGKDDRYNNPWRREGQEG